MPNHVTNIIAYSGDRKQIAEMLETIKNDEYGIGNVKAILDVTIDKAIAIHGVKLIKSRNGDFVSMPSDKWKNTQGEVKHTDIVHPIDSSTRAELFKTVSDAYEAYVQKQDTNELPFGMN